MLAIRTLELSFTILLVFMTAVTGLFAAFVVVRVVEPKGIRALVAKLRGKTPPGYRSSR